MPRPAMARYTRRPMRSAIFPSLAEQPSAWPALSQAQDEETPATRPALHQRASSNLDPAVPIFIPNPQPPSCVSPLVPRPDLNPQTRHQEKQESPYLYQQGYLPTQEQRSSFVPPPITQQELQPQSFHETNRLFDPHQQFVAPLAFPPYPLDATSAAQVNILNEVFGSYVTAAFFEGPNPFIDLPEFQEPGLYNAIDRNGRAARWRERKALEANQRAHVADSKQISSVETGESIGQDAEIQHEFAPSSVDQSEWKFEEPLLQKTPPAPGVGREESSWAKTSEIREEGHDRAMSELQHRVGLNRQIFRKAPIKPVALLLHGEIRDQWFATDRPVVRLDETMSSYAERAAEMKDMTEEALESILRDRQVGVRVKELALVYQGVTFELQKEYLGNGAWR